MSTPSASAPDIVTAMSGPTTRPLNLWLTARAYANLLLMDVAALWSFPAIRAAVRRAKVAPLEPDLARLVDVREAVKHACIFYFKPVHCLQRSAVVTRLLRRRGVPAELVIGYLPNPIKSHAWVEVNGAIVSDATKGQEFYLVIDRW